MTISRRVDMRIEIARLRATWIARVFDWGLAEWMDPVISFPASFESSPESVPPEWDSTGWGWESVAGDEPKVHFIAHCRRSQAAIAMAMDSKEAGQPDPQKQRIQLLPPIRMIIDGSGWD